MKIAIMGYGVVGSGVARVIETNRESMIAKVGCEAEVKYILDLRDFPDDPLGDRVVHDLNVILEDPEVEIVVETMGGLHPAVDFAEKALKAGKSVVTSNKDMVAEFGSHLIKLAYDNKVDFFYEASVGGGIPIIRAMATCMPQENISGIMGILNGTTNYILTEMEWRGSSFADALADAQAKGFAELNPENDIKGKDSCRKLAILSGIAYDSSFDWKEIETVGIDQIDRADITAAGEGGYRIKLIGHSANVDGKIYAAVEPMLVPLEHPMAGIHREYNCIMLQGNMVEDIYFQGKGAGSLATGSAVVADVLVAIAHKKQNRFFRRNMDLENRQVYSFGDLARDYMVRVDKAVSAVNAQVLCEQDGIYAYRIPNVTRAQLEAETESLRRQGYRVESCIVIEEGTQC